MSPNTTREVVSPQTKRKYFQFFIEFDEFLSDEFIALSIVDGLDAEGVLTIGLEDILQSAPDEWEIEMDEVEAVLHLIQLLDPLGIAARDLRECLLIQLRALPDDTARRSEAIVVVDQYINHLANRDYTHIAIKTHLKEPELRCNRRDLPSQYQCITGHQPLRNGQGLIRVLRFYAA